MRKLDRFIIGSFIGPFLLTTGLATFVLLIQYMMKYFDDLVGKNLGFAVFAELLFYFSLNMLQVALPLGVLVSSLMTFGNLGEKFELTAIKSAGISLVRALQPVLLFVVVLAYLAFNFNNYVVPSVNLKAYSLLYDIKQKKAALNITAGVFYDEIPDYSIYAKEKLPDNKTLKDVMIYDHTTGNGNKRVILADSSLMYTILNEKYLKLELFDGYYFMEEEKKRETIDQLFRSKFEKMDIVFNLSSFDLQRTKEELFQNNRQMKNLKQLNSDIDSLKIVAVQTGRGMFANIWPSYKYFFNDRGKKLQDIFKVEEKRDSARQALGESILMTAGLMPDFMQDKPIRSVIVDRKPKILAARELADSMRVAEDSLLAQDSLAVEDSLASSIVLDKKVADSVKAESVKDWAYLDSFQKSKDHDILLFAKNNAQNVKVNLGSTKIRLYNLHRDISKYTIEKHKKYSQAVACIVMFLIGAPLGAIIKKGGLGVPVIISIAFFLSYYVTSIMCYKWANEGLLNPVVAAWLGNVVLLPFGLFFLRQARIDARLFEVDFYNIWIDKLKSRFAKR
ncbi:LptF/LptG family permease [Marinoscillum sp. MHG1-6]|uniref:LptF/LptG family permease n=1 Tax=Marinoscillum sp. MHG1-6 TaxID=2959627 RepID=UPI002157C641|nr:LptF/LptG family permease [Marinoscillum sp. MHG1-6]